jgi:3-hydroxyacyl-[acyl-carrier-protein] dehydratase
MNDSAAWLERLPQAPPARYLDAITAHDPGVAARGQLCLPPGHRAFEGHLPGRPLVPGVLLIEALAQLAGVALLGPGATMAHGVIGAVDRMRFRRLIEPGELVELEARLLLQLGSAARFAVRATVAGAIACEGELTIGGIQ